MQRRFTCFPPPRFDLKRLMKLFYPRTGLGPTHYPLFSHEMGNWASPHFSRFPSLWFFCHWCKPQWIIRGTFDRWSVMFAKLPCFPFVKKKKTEFTPVTKSCSAVYQNYNHAVMQKTVILRRHRTYFSTICFFFFCICYLTTCEKWLTSSRVTLDRKHYNRKITGLTIQDNSHLKQRCTGCMWQKYVMGIHLLR